MQSRSNRRIPFSWTLLLISLLHFSIYSIGVCEAASRDFFVRQQVSLKSCSGSSSRQSRHSLLSEQISFHKLVQESPLRAVRQAQSQVVTKSNPIEQPVISAVAYTLALLSKVTFEQETPAAAASATWAA